jgi:soluble lytic murein transglycosylase
MRSARRLGDDEVTIVKACAGAEVNATKVAASLDAVSGEARQDVGYTLSRAEAPRRRGADQADAGGPGWRAAAPRYR